MGVVWNEKPTLSSINQMIIHDRQGFYKGVLNNLVCNTKAKHLAKMKKSKMSQLVKY